jgi:hypothetical protein
MSKSRDLSLVRVLGGCAALFVLPALVGLGLGVFCSDIGIIPSLALAVVVSPLVGILSTYLYLKVIKGGGYR